MTLRRTGLILATTFLATAVHPQDTSAVCPRGEGVFYGSPFTLEQVYLIPGQPPAAPPSGDSLFPDPGAGSAAVPLTCEGGGIVGAIDCVAERIEGSGTSAAPEAMPPVEAEARAALDAPPPESEPQPAAPRVVRQILVLKPVLVPGALGQVRYVPDGPGGLEVPEDLTEAEIAAVSPMVAARNAELLAYRGDLSLEVQDDLIRGMPQPLPIPPLPEGVSLAGDPAVLAINAECGALFRAMTETARLLQLRVEKVARIARLKEMLKAERDKAGLLGLLWDSETADRLERIIAMEEGNLAQIDQRLGEHKATIDRRERWLANEDRARELEAIKADPDRLAAETRRRRDAIIAAARDAARARWLLIEGEAAYARQLAAHDAMIKAARENGQDDLADKLEEDKSRLEAARDSWREHAQSMIDVRLREEARLMQENSADGIGPVSDATSILLAEGKNPVEVIESGAREGARALAERRALTDSATLGGSATETYDLVDFGQDLFETNLEMQRDPALFYGRFGSYLGGAAEAAYDGVVDLAVIGVEAGDLAGEAFESGLTDFTGYEFNAFGRENLETLVSAGSAISETDVLKLGELAGRAADAADRRFGQMAASGEAGIRDALETTGYVTASVLGAEELAMAGTMRVASAVRDAVRGGEALADVAKLADGVTDAGRLADAAGDAARIDAPPSPDTPPLADPLPVPDPAKIDAPKLDPEDLTETVRIDPASPNPDTPATPDPPDPDKTGPTPKPEPDAPATPDPADPGKTDPAPDPVTPDTPDPDKPNPLPDPDAPNDPDDLTSTDPEDLAETVRTDPLPPEPKPAPDTEPKPVDRDAVTEPDPATDPIDRDAVTEPDPAADPIDRDAITEPDPATDPVEAKGAKPDAVDDPGLAPDAPPKDPPEPGPVTDNPADAPPPRETAAASDAPADEALPKTDPAEANQPRGPPESPREALPIDVSRLDTTLDETPGYFFKEPLGGVDDLPRGGRFSGNPVRTTGKIVRTIPGSALTAPDGTTISLGKQLGVGGTASVFANAGDPDTILKIVDAVDDRRALVADMVGRKIGEKIQDPSGNGLFRMSKIEQEFLVANPNGYGSWSIKVEENLARADGITDAATRFAKREPSPEEELTMALALREMNNRGVVWTDHKPENFDIIRNDASPTGYQMVIFDTGGIRPVTGATAESRARTAIEVQRTFDRTSRPFGNPDSLVFGDNYTASVEALDNRVFPESVGVLYTMDRVKARPKGDRYLDFALWSDAELQAYARSLLGKETPLPIQPP